MGVQTDSHPQALANELLDFDDYIERVIREFDESQVAKYYVDLSYVSGEFLSGP